MINLLLLLNQLLLNQLQIQSGGNLIQRVVYTRVTRELRFVYLVKSVALWVVLFVLLALWTWLLIWSLVKSWNSYVCCSASPSNQQAKRIGSERAAKLTIRQLQMSERQPNSHANAQSKTNDCGCDAHILERSESYMHKLQISNNTTLNIKNN